MWRGYILIQVLQENLYSPDAGQKNPSTDRRSDKKLKALTAAVLSLKANLATINFHWHELKWYKHMQKSDREAGLESENMLP